MEDEQGHERIALVSVATFCMRQMSISVMLLPSHCRFAIIGATDQLLSEKVHRDSYLSNVQELQGAVSRLKR